MGNVRTESNRHANLVLSAVGPDDARERAASQADQGSQRLTHGAEIGAGLGEQRLPIGNDVEKAGQQTARGFR
jgi:hypothetical protein